MNLIQLFKAALIITIGANAIAIHADDLRFTSGSLSDQTVSLTVAGNSNLVCELQRLQPTNDTWTAVSTFTLNSNGVYYATNSLIDGYGYFRVQSTNGTYHSTNAFGAMSIVLPQGWSMLGNPFDTLHLTDIFPSPEEGMNVDTLTDGQQWNDIASYDFGEWNHDDAIVRGQGMAVRTYTTNIVAQLYGLFSTNGFSVSLPPGWSMVMTPLYHITDYNSMQVDSLDSNHLGGLSTFPLSTGTNPQARLGLIVGTVGPTFDYYDLGTNNVWKLGTNAVSSIPITWSESVWWRNTQTNSITWTVNSVPIW